MSQLLENLKNLLSMWLTQVVLKAAGPALVVLGISAGSVTEIVTGVVAFIVGFIGQKIQVTTALNTPVPKS
jgi:hypothetical protein